MPASDSIQALLAISRQFGPRTAAHKVKLLVAIAAAEHIKPRDLTLLQDVLNFVRAYPDTAAVRSAVHATVKALRRHVEAATPDRRGIFNNGLPGGANSYPYSYAVLQQLIRAWPGSCEIDWDAYEDDAPLLIALQRSVAATEADGLDDERLTSQDWLEAARPPGTATALETALTIIDGGGHRPGVDVQLFEVGDVPVHYSLAAHGQGRCEVELPGARRIYQQSEIPRDKFPLPPLIRRPLPPQRPVPAREGRQLIDLALTTLCARNLEIYSLIYANPRDVFRVRCANALEVILVGTQPEYRADLESLYFFLVVKNGVPVGYGPAGVFLGASEMGINLFPEFRGGEIRFIYSQVMRALHQVLGADYFFLQAYGMGLDNPDAITSGSFWFYRKLGFSAENPEVETLALAEEQRMRETPGYRSSTKMLHRLKHTRAYLDLSGGRSRWLDFPALGVALTTMLGRRFRGDRTKATATCVREMAKRLRIAWSQCNPAQRAALETSAPILSMLPDLKQWSAHERAALGRACKAKGAPSEAAAARAFAAHPRLRDSLRALLT